MKNVSRNKFLLCFRPVVDMDLMLDSKASAVVDDPPPNRHALTTYLTVKNKEELDTMKPSKARSPVSDTENSIMLHRHGKKTFSQVIKAVAFEILLAKRAKDRKCIDGGSYSSRHNNPSCSPDNLLDTSEGFQDTISKSNSVPNSTQNTSKHGELEVKPGQEGIRRSSSSSLSTSTSSSSSNAVYLLVISLVVTIFWGKIWAILLTSIWLYFFPHLQQPAGVIVNLESIKRISQKKSRGYKKKVIMEGLLQRKQSRGSFNFSH